MEPIYREFEEFYNAELKKHVRLPECITARYQIKACLVSDARKEVYLLHSKDEQRHYVLKRLSDENKQANETEYSLLQNLDHPGIPKAAEFFEENGSSYFIRPYAEGESLHQIVKTHGTFTEKGIADIALRLCDTLMYLHSQKPPVIHRDIKPSNVIYASDGRVTLIDFGISRRFNTEASEDTVFIGTSVTAPPEQFGYAQTDMRSDIYALGILMIFLFTGRYDRAALRDMPRGLARIAERCTQFAPGDRYASAAQLKRALLLYKRAPGIKIVKAAALVACLAAAFSLGRLFPLAAAAPAPTVSPAKAGVVQTYPPARRTAVAPDGTVSFASALIEQDIRAQLNKTADEPVMIHELERIRELSIVGNLVEANARFVSFDRDRVTAGDRTVQRGDIQTITDISLLKNLNELALVYQNISDISPLKDLNLTFLNIEGNFISDISPLDGMPALKELFASYNPVSDLSPLSSLHTLKRLSLQRVPVSDITPLTEMQALEAVDLFGVPCADYSPLAALPALVSVNISESSAQDVAVVVKNKRIKELIAHRCGITDLDLFKELIDLERLELWQNEIDDLTGIEILENLKHLNLDYTPVKDLSPLTGLERLEELCLYQVEADLTPLLSIPSLKKIRCTPDMQEAVSHIANAHFTIEIIEG